MCRPGALAVLILCSAATATAATATTATRTRRTAATDRPVISPARRTLQLFNQQVLIRQTIADNAGTCELLLTKPPRSSHAVLHMELCGRGTRSLVRQIIASLHDGFRECDGNVVCIVDMKSARGSSLGTLPPVARFMMQHGRKLEYIMIVEVTIWHMQVM